MTESFELDEIKGGLTNKVLTVESDYMRYFQLYLLLIVLWFVSGCVETVQNAPNPQGTDKVKITDLRDPMAYDENTENLMSFRVLTYTISPDAIDKLNEVFALLSMKDVRLANKDVFHENGFAVGTGVFEEGAKVAQKLSQIGAVRTSQARMMFPPDTPEAFSRTMLQGTERIHYTSSVNDASVIRPPQGFIGWVFSGSPDPRFRGMAQIKAYPAIWQPGNENIRVAMGKEAIDYKPMLDGQVLVRIEEGGFLLLGPARDVPDETTLDRMLFFLLGRRSRIQFFVIICDAAGT